MIPARTQLVNGARDQLFARSRFSKDQNRGVRGGYVRDLFQYPLETGVLTDDFVELVSALEFLFEVGFLLFASPQRFFGFLFFRKVANHAEHYLASCRVYRAQHDIDGKLASILTTAIKFKTGTHGTHAWVAGIVPPVFRVRCAESLGNQNFNGL